MDHNDLPSNHPAAPHNGTDTTATLLKASARSTACRDVLEKSATAPQADEQIEQLLG